MQSIRARLVVPFLFWGAAAGAEAGVVRYLSTPDYFDAVTAEISGATSSVTACLYLFTLDPGRPESKTLQLANALADASRRGVKVEVVLDGGGPEPGRNSNAADYLVRSGVDVFFSSCPMVVHAKTLVVDGSAVVAGSFNWSEAALSHNLEGALLVRDPEAARAALADIRRAGRRDPPVRSSTGSAHIPLAFFTNPKLLGTMVRESQNRAFDTYLFLLKTGAERGVFDLDTRALAEHLGIAGRTREKYRARIFDTLRVLQNQYGLIRVELVFKKEPRVEILSMPGDVVVLPPEYFDWGWGLRLDLEGKVTYLLNLRYSESSPIRPRWSTALRAIAAENHLKLHAVSRGTIELRRANLVEVDYDEVDRFAEKPRRPNIYTPRSFYDPAVLQERWKSLAARYGEEKLSRARRCLRLVYEDSDADAAEKLIKLEEEFGRGKMEEAYRIIEKKKADNPRRSVAYFIGLVKGLSEGRAEMR